MRNIREKTFVTNSLCRLALAVLIVVTAFASPAGCVTAVADETETAVLADAAADKTKLKEEIDSAEKLNAEADTYTSATWDVLYAAYTDASKVYSDESASQSEVDAQMALLSAARNALVKVSTAALADGTYQINAEIVNAADPSRLSMADGALDADTNSKGKRVKKPLTLVVKNGQCTLTMKFVSLTNDLNGTSFTGYLGKLQYYPDYEDTTKLPGANEKLADATVVSTYEKFDDYNDSEFGLDDTMRGIPYPERVSIPVTIGDTEIWLKVYVPVMEGIAAGCGTQQARLILDWSDSSLKQVRDSSIDLEELAEQIKSAKAVVKGEASDESWNTLQTAITTAQSVYDNLSSTQTEIDAQVSVLEKAMALIHLENGTVDKSRLDTLIDEAEGAVKKESEYTKSCLDVLSTVLTYAKGVYESDSADQQSVDAAVQALSSAITGLVKISSIDTKKLETAINKAEGLVKKTDTYTSDSISTLQIAINNAKRVLANADKTQDDVDSQVTSLSNAQKGLIKKKAVDKSSLKKKIKSAREYAKKTSTYTAASIKSLKKAITVAESVYNDKSATQKSVNTQITSLKTAISGLVKKTGSDSSGSTKSSDNKSLDVKKLADGVYSVTGNMVKIDKKTASMSDAAINHTIKLTVKKGKYYITMNFNGLTVSDKLGYLSKLKYFKTGYTLDNYGNPNGSLASVKVDSYQKNSDGSRVSDSYGTNYPDEVTFALIPEALNDGYVPLQVFVPIMEAISAGTGTQPVFLALDWKTLKKTTADSADFSKTDASTESTTEATSEVTTESTTEAVKTRGDENKDTSKKSSKLDVDKLDDGVYSVTGNMVKIDKKTASMSDAAINHTIKLTVKKGKYYITMNFNGLTVSNKLGYLSKLKYFKTAYTLDNYGNPNGSLASVKVDSYQKNSDGSLVSDSYGTDYPDEVTFALIPEAREDGYVPLQVFVPIMEAISAGTGTQPVFLKLDWTTLKSTTSDDAEFDKTNESDNKDSKTTTEVTTEATTEATQESSTNGTTTGKSSLGGGSTLSGGSTLGGGSTIGGNAKLSSVSAIGDNSTLTGGTALGESSELTGNSTLGDGSELGTSPLDYTEDSSEAGDWSNGTEAADNSSEKTMRAEAGSDSASLNANTLLLVFIFVGEVVIFVCMMAQRKRAKRELGDDE